MLLPVIILGGIYSGIFTPTESAAIGVAYGMFFGVFVYKELDAKKIRKIILESSLLVGAVLVIVGASVTFGRILTLERLPTEIAQFILSLTENKIAILLAINLLLLVVGTFMENSGRHSHLDANLAADSNSTGYAPSSLRYCYDRQPGNRLCHPAARGQSIYGKPSRQNPDRAALPCHFGLDRRDDCRTGTYNVYSLPLARTTELVINHTARGHSPPSFCCRIPERQHFHPTTIYPCHISSILATIPP